MSDQTEFNLGWGEEKKRDGKGLAASNRADLLMIAEREAIKIAREGNGQCCADDVQERLIELGHTPSDLGNAAGSMFDGKKWMRIGYKKSERVSRHANVIGIWELRKIWL